MLVCLLFIHVSIHNNLTKLYRRYYACYRRLLTLQALVNNALTWQSSCVIATCKNKITTYTYHTRLAIQYEYRYVADYESYIDM